MVFWSPSNCPDACQWEASDAKTFAQSTEAPCLSYGDSSRTPPSNAPAHVWPPFRDFIFRSRSVVGKVALQHAAARRRTQWPQLRSRSRLPREHRAYRAAVATRHDSDTHTLRTTCMRARPARSVAHCPGKPIASLSRRVASESWEAK
jgi:hypothetical protein